MWKAHTFHAHLLRRRLLALLLLATAAVTLLEQQRVTTRRTRRVGVHHAAAAVATAVLMMSGASVEGATAPAALSVRSANSLLLLCCCLEALVCSWPCRAPQVGGHHCFVAVPPTACRLVCRASAVVVPEQHQAGSPASCMCLSAALPLSLACQHSQPLRLQQLFLVAVVAWC